MKREDISKVMKGYTLYAALGGFAVWTLGAYLVVRAMITPTWYIANSNLEPCVPSVELAKAWGKPAVVSPQEFNAYVNERTGQDQRLRIVKVKHAAGYTSKVFFSGNDALTYFTSKASCQSYVHEGY